MSFVEVIAQRVVTVFLAGVFLTGSLHLAARYVIGSVAITRTLTITVVLLSWMMLGWVLNLFHPAFFAIAVAIDVVAVKRGYEIVWYETVLVVIVQLAITILLALTLRNLLTLVA